MLLCQLRDHPLGHRSLAVQTSSAVDVCPLIFSLQSCFGRLLFLFTVSIRRLNATLDLRSRWFPQQHECICLLQHILCLFFFTNVIVLLTNAAAPAPTAAETCPLPHLWWTEVIADRGGGGQRSRRGRKAKVGSADPRMLLGSDWDHLLVCLLFSSHNEYRLFALCQHFWLCNPSHKKKKRDERRHPGGKGTPTLWLVGVSWPLIVVHSPQKRLCLRCLPLLWCYCYQDTERNLSLEFSGIRLTNIAGHTFRRRLRDTNTILRLLVL